MKRILMIAGVLLLVPFWVSASGYAFSRQAAEGIKLDDVKLGKDVKDRQLADEASDFAVNDKVYLWVKVSGAAGETLAVTWKNGDHTYKSSMTVGGSPWRTWCYKNAALAGNWTVAIADAKGTVLKELNFKVGN